jgi:hypothetical protein
MLPPQQGGFGTQGCGEEADPFAALDALEELAGPLPTQAPLSVDTAPRQNQNIQGALLREARNIVANKSKPSAEANEALQRLRSNPGAGDSQAGNAFAPAQQSLTPAPLPVQAFTASPPAVAPLQQHQPLQQQPLQQQQPPVQQQPVHQQQQPKPVVSAMTYHNPSAESWDSDEEESQSTGLVKAAAQPPLAPAPLQQAPLAQIPPVRNGWTAPANPHNSAAPPAKKVDPDASGWDSDEEVPVRQQAGHTRQAAPPPLQQQAVPPPLHHQQATAEVAGLSDNDWDDDDHTAVKAPVRKKAPAVGRDACGAPMQPTQAFVIAAKPPKQVAEKKKAGGDDDLDDLVGELMESTTSAPSRSGTSHGLVPGFQCTGCDFQVLRIENYIWGTGVEYMFFRNNYPNVQKMRPQLVPRKDCCAYCCQCSWKSAEAAAPLEDVAAGLRWRKINF